MSGRLPVALALWHSSTTISLSGSGFFWFESLIPEIFTSGVDVDGTLGFGRRFSKESVTVVVAVRN